jgi:hypothetical protein
MEPHDVTGLEGKEGYLSNAYPWASVPATRLMSQQSDSDPYDLDLPNEWCYTVEDGRVVYENEDSTVRVSITEFSRHLQVYWWVDVFTREGDDEWTKREAGLGDSFRDPDDAARVAEVLVESVEEGDDFTELPVSDIV